MNRRTQPLATRPRRLRPTRTIRPTILTAVAVALLLAACGESASSGAPTETTPAVPDTVESHDSPDPTTEPVEPADDHDGATEVRADAGEPEPEFIELSYWEGVLAEGFIRTPEPEGECDDSDPDVQICEWEMSFESVTTHLGRARDLSTGVVTQHFAESCDGPDGTVGHVISDEGSGSITAAWGEELHFRNDSRWCSEGSRNGSAGWQVVGGTGRFEDAFGVMSIAFVPEPEYVSISVGTLHVRADLWEPILSTPGE